MEISKIGMTKKDAAEASGGDFGDVVSISSLEPGRYRFRFVTKGVKLQRIFWPTIAEDLETGESKETSRAVIVPKKGDTVLDVVASFDKRTQIEEGADPGRVRSTLDRSKKWVFLGFDRREDPPVFCQIDTPWTIFAAIRDLQEAPDPDDATRLMYGLYEMFDVIITVLQSSKISGYKGRSYKVEPLAKNPFAGTVPTEWLQGKPEEVNEQWYIEKGIFTQEEMTAILESPLDLEELAEPDSKDRIAEMLVEFPIDLKAEWEDKPRFSYPERLIEKLEQEGIKYLKNAGAGSSEEEEEPPFFMEENPPLLEENTQNQKAEIEDAVVVDETVTKQVDAPKPKEEIVEEKMDQKEIAHARLKAIRENLQKKKVVTQEVKEAPKESQEDGEEQKRKDGLAF